ncbi:MAG TPA: hypothetical protein PLW70_07295 [Bacteroidales bacterium]|jgi:hypothetical protein|nr:hypothetical protein [Bacteroidales bacterium]
MEIVEVVRKNDMYIGRNTDMALNLETQIGVFQNGGASFDFLQKVGCNRLYSKTTTYKILYNEKNYNEAWQYVQDMNGGILSIENDFDAVMKDEKLERLLGNVRLNRMVFELKQITNGKDCEPCEC